jgi:hypothetical protein
VWGSDYCNHNNHRLGKEKKLVDVRHYPLCYFHESKAFLSGSVMKGVLAALDFVRLAYRLSLSALLSPSLLPPSYDHSQIASL